MNENKTCSLYLGVIIAEGVLSLIFKNEIKKMVNGNPGFDFICDNGWKIDVKSSCRRICESCADSWYFTIKRNTTADYFLCMGFNNRDDLDIEHVWLIPGDKINHLVTIAIHTTTTSKWELYEKTELLNDIKFICDSRK